MAILLFIVMPIGWSVTGRLLGSAVSLSVGTEGGKRLGRRLGWLAMGMLPVVYFVLFFLGASGDAGHGVRLFGSAELFGLMCLPLYSVPALGLYVIVVYIIRDLIRGLLPRQS